MSIVYLFNRVIFILFLVVASRLQAAEIIVCSSLTTLHDGRACTTTNAAGAISSAVPGDRVILRAGDNFNIGNIGLPANDGSGKIIIESSRVDEIVDRVGPADVAAGRIATLAFSNSSTMRTVPGQLVVSSVDVNTDRVTFSTSISTSLQNGDEISATMGRNSPLHCSEADGTNDPYSYGSGTVTVTNGSKTVTGAGVSWNSEINTLMNNRAFRITSDPTVTYIATYVNDTTLTLDRPYEGATASGRPYLIDGPCIGRPSSIYVRFGTITLTNGLPVRVFGKSLPPELRQGGTYWIRDYGFGSYGTFNGSGTFRLAATAGGPALTFSSKAQALYIEYPVYPLQANTGYFVVNKSGQSVQLALTKGGPPINLTHVTGMPWFAKVEAAQNYTFRGIRMVPQPGHFLFYTALLGEFANHVRSLPKNFNFEKFMWGGNWGADSLYYGIGFNGDGLTIRDSYCSDVAGTPDTQCLSSTNSKGNILVENTYLSAMGENFMAGGAHPSIRGIQPENLTFRRVHFHKPKYWWAQLAYGGAANNGFRLRSRWQAENCNVSATRNVGGQCFGYDRNEVRYPLLTDVIFGMNPSQTGTVEFGIRTGIGWYAQYTSTITGLTCPTGFTCEAVGSINWPADALKYGRVTMSNGTPTHTNTGLVSSWVAKNSFEVKLGRRVACEGCVFQNVWLHVAGGQWQGPTIHPQIASTNTEPFAYWLGTTDMLFKNSVWLDVITGTSLQQSTNINSLRKEARTTNVGGRHVFRNNLIAGNDNVRLGFYTGTNIAYQASNTTFRVDAPDVVLDHNTIVDAELGSVQFNSTAGQRIQITNNIWVPIKRNGGYLPHAGGTGQNQYCGLINAGRNAGGIWDRNILMNRNGVTNPGTDVGTCGIAGIEYPTNTWLISGTQDLPATLFRAWAQSLCDPNSNAFCVDRTYATNLRIATAQYKSGGARQATDGRDLGADIDEIESETGPWGSDVIAGRPPFYIRSSRNIMPGATSAVISYTPLDAVACTLKVWGNPAYSGTPAVDMNDSGVGITGGSRQVRLSSLTSDTEYYGKRWCGNAVDVFSFRTLSTDEGRTIHVNGAAVSAFSAVLESGTTAESLAAGAPVACSSTCTLAIPGDHKYYRVAYHNSNNQVLSRSDVTLLP